MQQGTHTDTGIGGLALGGGNGRLAQRASLAIDNEVSSKIVSANRTTGPFKMRAGTLAPMSRGQKVFSLATSSGRNCAVSRETVRRVLEEPASCHMGDPEGPRDPLAPGNRGGDCARALLFPLPGCRVTPPRRRAFAP